MQPTMRIARRCAGGFAAAARAATRTDRRTDGQIDTAPFLYAYRIHRPHNKFRRKPLTKHVLLKYYFRNVSTTEAR